MFIIPVGDLLSSYDGDSQTFSFEAPVFDGFYDDIQFITPLSFTLKLIGYDGEIHSQFRDFKTKVVYETKTYTIHIQEFDRTWKFQREADDGDDIGLINSRNLTIDLKEMIREEIIMECHGQSL